MGRVRRAGRWAGRRAVRLKAHAKVNYALDVVGVRPDGYHEVRMVLQSVSLADEVTVERTDGGFELVVEPEGVSVGPKEENTAFRAWRLLGDHVGEDLPARITLRKNIPAGAGLGGGSSDAAAVLRALDGLFGLGLPDHQMRAVGKEIGADVPFCLSGGTALGEGVGEVLTPLPAPPEHRVLIAKPFRGADTGGIYRSYDANPTGDAASAKGVLSALGSGSLKALAAALGNDLAPVTKRALPEVADLEAALLSAGALGASMTGTGTAVYGLFADEGSAKAAGKELTGAHFVGVCAPVTFGWEEVPAGVPGLG